MRPSTRTTSGTCCAPLKAAGASSILVLPVERLGRVSGLAGARAKRLGAAARRRDRRRRARARRRCAARLDASGSTASGRSCACRRSGSRRPGWRRRARRGSRARGRGRGVLRAAAPARRRGRGGARASWRSGAGCRSRSVGIYVPGGRAILPSSLVMAAVPARLAGVERIVVVTPRPQEATLAAARELGIEEVYAVGGAQAVAALAYGTETIAPVDKIVGPGNRWVTAAKLLVSSRVGIDLPGRAERGRADRRRERRRRPRAPPTCWRRPSTGRTARRRCSRSTLRSPRPSRRDRGRADNVDVVSSRPRRGARPLGGVRARASRALGRDAERARAADPERRHRLRPHLGRRRRLRGRRDPHPADGRARTGHGRARAGDVPQAGAGRPRERGGARRARGRSACRWRDSKDSTAHAAALELA